MPTVSDYIVDRLYQECQGPVFLVVGGYAMHLNDAVARHPREEWVCCHHEQAVAMAADGYAKASGRLGVAYLTAGPGAINSLNGVAGSYLDSSPCIFIVGQLKSDLLLGKGLRQFGFQGFDTLSLAKTMTKYATSITDKAQVKSELEKCIAIAKSGRRGPVWLEVPVDIQGAPFDPKDYADEVFKEPSKSILDPKLILKVANLIKVSERPCLLIGAGIRASGALTEMTSFINRREIPVMTSRNGMDLIDSNHPFFAGRPGVYGSRGANFAIEACDLFISIGARLEILVVGYDYRKFAPLAKKVVLDSDASELMKPSIDANIKILGDAKDFILSLDRELGDFRFKGTEWLSQISDWKKRYPVQQQEYAKEEETVNSYYFLDALAKAAEANATFVIDTCHAIYTFPQSFEVKAGQRHLLTGGLATMGYFAAAIGAASADRGRSVYAVTGDGALQMNIQELQTIKHNNLNVKIVVLNNNGYLLIKLTQTAMLDGRFIGSTPESGLSFPDLKKIAAAYDIGYLQVKKASQVAKAAKKIATSKGPLLIEVLCPEDQPIVPRLRGDARKDGTIGSPCFDNMYPYLPEAEYRSNRRWHKSN